MSVAAISAFLAGVGLVLPWVAPMLRPTGATLARSALIVLLCFGCGGLLAFAILLLGGTPRPMSDTNWWLYKSGIVVGSSVVFILGHRYGPRAGDPHRLIVGLLAGMVLGTAFHWLAPAGTNTYAALWFFGIVGGLGGFLWEMHYRRGAKKSDA